MGYEEVETVLPSNFVTRSRPAPEQPKATSESGPVKDSDVASAVPAKKRGRRSRRGVVSLWRENRKKSRTRRSSKSRKEPDTHNSNDEENSNTVGNKSTKSKSEPKSRKSSRFNLFTIKSTDSNATVVASNTSKSKREKESTAAKREKESATAKREKESTAANVKEDLPVNYASAPEILPTLEEGRHSPTDSSGTLLTCNSCGEENASTTQPGEAIKADDVVVEVGDEEDQYMMHIPSATSRDMEQTKTEEPVLSPVSKAKSLFSIIKSTTSYYDQDLSTVSPTALPEVPLESFPLSSPTASLDIATALSCDGGASVQSRCSTKSTKSTKSIFSNIKLSKSNGDTKSKALIIAKAHEQEAVDVSSTTASPVIATALSCDGGASVQSQSSTESTIRTEAVNNTSPIIATALSCDGGASVQSQGSNKSIKTEAVNNTNSEALALVDHSSNARWIKKVSLSIGGYNTSFTVSDPMAAVKDALDVVGSDEDLCQQAKELDGIHANDEDEDDDRDYDDNPTRLFVFIQQRAWPLALTQLQNYPEEAKIWVFRKAVSEKAPNAHDANENMEALVIQHTSLVVHDGRETAKFRWRLLPLHAAIVLGAPADLIYEIIRSYPNAAQKTDERGSLPVHLASSRLDVDPEGEKVVLQLFGAYPDSIEIQDRKGRTPSDLAKLARSREEVEEQRKKNSCNPNSNQIVMGESLHEQLKLADEAGKDVQVDDEDNRSVKSSSSLSGRFQQMLFKSKSSDTAFRRKKKKNNDKQENDAEIAGLTLSKSMDRGCDDKKVADDATVAEDLRPGFAFLRTSKNQEAREQAMTEQGKKESFAAVKKIMISPEYHLPANSPRCCDSPTNIPLPRSFSLGSPRSCDSPTNIASPHALSLGDEMSSLVSNERKSSYNKSVTIAEERNVDYETVISHKSVTIAEELNVDHEAVIIEDKDTNEGLLALLEKAAENAGRRGMDVTGFIKVLEDEWVTDVEALRRLDGGTLDELLPLMLSRELQRLINHADSIDSKFLENRGRGRSPTKKKKKKRSIRRIKKIPRDRQHQSAMQPEGSLASICEAEEKSQPAHCNDDGVEQNEDKHNDITTDTSEEQDKDDENTSYDDALMSSASMGNSESERHINLIAMARKTFPTRAALEDCIQSRRAEVEAVVNSSFAVDKETLERAALADEEVRNLLPLRLVLPTMADLEEMVLLLQEHKEDAIRKMNDDKTLQLTFEIEELQGQIDLERRYMAAKRPKGILKRREKIQQEFVE